MQIQGAEIFTKQNVVPRQTTWFSYWTEVVLTTPEWSSKGLTGLLLAISHTEKPWGAPCCHNQFSGGIRASWGNTRTIWLWSDCFKSIWIWSCVCQNPILFCKLLRPLNCREMFFLLNLQMDLNFWKKKTVLKSVTRLLRYLTDNQLYKSNIFIGHPLFPLIIYFSGKGFFWIFPSFLHNLMLLSEGLLNKLKRNPYPQILPKQGQWIVDK